MVRLINDMPYDYKRELDRIVEFTEMVKSGPKGMQQAVDALGSFSIHDGDGGIMRGIAEKILPARVEFQIFTTIGGNSQIVITRIGERD